MSCAKRTRRRERMPGFFRFPRVANETAVELSPVRFMISFPPTLQSAYGRFSFVIFGIDNKRQRHTAEFRRYHEMGLRCSRDVITQPLREK